ncbi:TrmH family RNA methyltransferase [Thermodesulfobacteriota bacterium]
MDIRLKRYRKDFEYSYSNGVYTTIELLQSRPEHALKVLLSSSGIENKGIAKIKELCEKCDVPVEVNDKLINRISLNGSHLAVGVFRKYETRLDPGENHVVLVNPGDMGNLGTIARTMLGFGMSDLALIRPAVDIFDPKAIRASMGSLFSLSVEYFEYFENYAERFDNNLYLFMTSGSQPVGSIKVNPPFTLVFGNESSGLPRELEKLGTKVTIPHNKVIDSLNISVALGIALYEFCAC